jgi:zinc transport system substrate-binding protein
MRVLKINELLSCLFALAFCALLAGCGRSAEQTQGAQRGAGKLLVGVSILPQAYFVQRIGGTHVEAMVMVSPGHSPATYEPTPKQMAQINRTDLYFSIGVPFEKVWLHRLAELNPNMTLVDTVAGIQLRSFKDADHHHHEGAGEDHHHEGHEADHEDEGGMKDPHVWLSPRLVEKQARAMLEALCSRDPQHRTDYERNFAQFAADLQKLDAEIKALLEPMKKRRFMVFHPSWGYFADEYGLEQVPVEISGREPSAQGLAELIASAKAQQIRVVFVQKQFSSQSASAIAKAIGGKVVAMDPLAEDYLENLRLIARTIAQENR